MWRNSASAESTHGRLVLNHVNPTPEHPLVNRLKTTPSKSASTPGSIAAPSMPNCSWHVIPFCVESASCKILDITALFRDHDVVNSASSKSRFRFKPAGIVLAGLLMSCILSGCVHRRLTIRSNPPGALVMVDGDEIGYTPVSTDFTYYGTREIKLIKPGFETLTTQQKIDAPFYQWVPLDFISDNLLLHKVKDKHDFTFQMHPQDVVPTQHLLDRANSTRSESQTGY